jgi:hypothetical protein
MKIVAGVLKLNKDYSVVSALTKESNLVTVDFGPDNRSCVATQVP